MLEQISNIPANNINFSSGTATEVTTGARFVGLLETVVNRSFDFMNKHTPAFLAAGATIYCAKHQYYFLTALGLLALVAVSNVRNASDCIKQKLDITGNGNKLNEKNTPQKTENDSKINPGATNHSANTDAVIQIAPPAKSLL